MNKTVVILGASGHGKVIADIVRLSGDHLLGFLDDNPALPTSIASIPVLGEINAYQNYPEAEFIIAIGNSSVRQRIAEGMPGVSWYTAVHPSAVISALSVHIGEGSAVMANAVVNPCASVGAHCIINSGAVVEHDNVIGSFSHISVGAKLAGSVSIGPHTWVGIGGVVSNNLSICGHCMIGAGAVVIDNIREPGTYVGVPARKIP